ncbi:MAG: hypothetical protein MUD13_05405 [Candidatus Nanopelagicales bacterium]|jgi:hypothetical protein|nr:hypothetical protein [Candidatus Nanopelagicales bacterium]
MTSSRRSAALGLLLLAPLALAGCEKPNPGVTVWSGTNSEHVQALCWEHEEGESLGAQNCAQDVIQRAQQGTGIATIEVRPGNTVGISVDPVVAESGWSVQISGQPLATGLTETYFRFAFPQNVPAGGEGFIMEVTAQAEGTGNRGIWFFRLLPS